MAARAILVRAAAFLSVLALSSASTVAVAPLASAAAITQTSPTSGTTTVASSNGFTDQLNGSGSSGVLTFSQSTSTSASLSVNASGQVLVNATLAVNSYTVSGSYAGSDTGNWSYTLTVGASPITQTSPTTGTTTTASSNGFTDTLHVSGNNGTVIYTQNTSNSANLSVNASGQVLVSAALSAGSYTVSGTDGDTEGDTGSWSYTLTVTVTGTTITQTSPTTGVTTVSASSTFNPGSIAVSNTGTVTFVTTVTSTGLNVSSGGVITTTGQLAAGSYTVSGTDHDTTSDTGTWTYTLTVTVTVNDNPPTPNALTQTSPTSGTTTVAASTAFNSGPLNVTNNVGTVTFVATNTSAGLTLSGNHISTTGALSVGHYTISGTDHDTTGNTGAWTYTLTVTNGIVQTSPTSGATTTAVSNIFFPGSIAVSNNTGAVVFATTESSTGLSVSSGGAITTKGTLAAGSYTVSGTDSDTSGNTGTWTYTLTVSNLMVTVNFDANGGKGTMAAERKNASTALTSNRFTRRGYTFVDWNTVANGSGTRYANGARYAFRATTTLYAQWRRHQVVVIPAIPAKANLGPFSLKSAALSLTLEGQIGTLANTVKTNHDTEILLVGYGDTLSAADARNESLWAANINLSQHRASAVEAYLRLRLAALGVKGYTITVQGNGAVTSGGTTIPSNTGLVVATLV